MVETNEELKGAHFQMIYGIYKEYNPEIAQEIEKRLSFDVNAIEPDKWYPWTDFLEFLDLTSPEARVAMLKMAMQTLAKLTPIFNDCSTPVDMINKLNLVSTDSYRNMSTPKYEVIESGDDFMKVKISDTPYLNYVELEEGVIRGLLTLLKIINVHVQFTREEDVLLTDVKWE